MLRAAVALVLLILAPAGVAAAAGPPTMPLDQVRAGMDCTAASVVHGTDVVTFAAHIDDVVAGASGPAEARILLTVSGPAVDATGIGAGFSGSPVTCPGPDGVGRIVGAISESIGAFGGRTVLATPIQAILGEPVDPPKAVVGRARAALLRRARPLAEPLSFAGLSPAVGRVFQRAAARAGRVLVMAPLRPAQAPAPAPAIIPGSAIGVTLATGDVEAGAIGTAAYVDGTTVWGFGHPLDAAGRRALFLTSAYVYGVVNNPVATQDASTYKLAAPTATIGTITQDGLNGVVGRTGPLPASFPLQVSVRDLDTRRLTGLRSRLTDERTLGEPTGVSALSTITVPAVVQGIYGALDGSPVRQSADMCIRISVRQRPKPLGFCNTYVGGGGSPDALAGGPIAADVAAATQLLDAYDAGPLTVTGVQVGLRLTRTLRIATLTRLTGPKVARRGQVISVRATLRRPGGATLRRMIRVAVPRGMPRGPRDLLLKGTDADVTPGSVDDSATIDVTSLFAPAGGQSGPASPAALAKDVAGLHRYDGVTARFLRRRSAIPQDLPGGAEGIAQRARRVLRDPLLRIDGRARLAIAVR